MTSQRGACSDGGSGPERIARNRSPACSSGWVIAWLRDRVRDTSYRPKAIDRAWVDEQAAGPDQDELTIGRRFFANTTEAERDLIAYRHMVQLVEEERLRLTEKDA
jgi:hypothetical protein